MKQIYISDFDHLKLHTNGNCHADIPTPLLHWILLVFPVFGSLASICLERGPLLILTARVLALPHCGP